MEFILTDKFRREQMILNALQIDVSVHYEDCDADNNTFSVQIEPDSYDASWMNSGCVIFSPNEEFGGEVGVIGSNTDENIVLLEGDTWRGKLKKKVISPPSGQAYKIVSGDVNAIIKELVDPCYSGVMQGSSLPADVSVTNYKFDRYCTLLDGINKMLRSVNRKLHIRYVQGEQGRNGYCEVSSSPIVDFTETLEISQDTDMNTLKFVTSNKMNGINHLICLGTGELTERMVVHLYVDQNGNISQRRTFTGNEDRTEVYDYPSVQDRDELIEGGIKRLQEVMNSQSFGFDADDLDLSVDISDIIGGKDYITGFQASKPVVKKIYRMDMDGVETVQYELEGEYS